MIESETISTSDEILDGLGRAKYFSCSDLQSGYHQIPLHRDSRPLTAYATEKGFRQWKAVPFGLNVAPASFTRMMTIAFSGLSPEQAFIYMDDPIVIGLSEKQHINNLTEVQFLGHTCTSNDILSDPSKLSAVEKYLRSTDKKESKRFVTFANYYRRFIMDFSGIARLLNEMPKTKSFQVDRRM